MKEKINQLDKNGYATGYWDGFYGINSVNFFESYVKGFLVKGKLKNGFQKRNYRETYYPDGHYMKNFEDWGYSQHPDYNSSENDITTIELIFH